jgi:hypothetical protein
MKQKTKKLLGLDTYYISVDKYAWTKQFKTYHVPYNKFVLTLAAVAALVCIVTPFTNWLLFPIIKLTRRFV